MTMQRDERTVSKLGAAHARRHALSMFFRHVAPASQPASSGHVTADAPTASPLPRTLLLWLTYGVAGTALFLIIYVIEGATRPGYDPWRQTISALSLGPGGWIQQLNFALCGASVLWLAYVWRKILAGGVCATWYPIMRGIEGVGLIAIAIVTQDPLHTVVLVVIVNAMSFGLFVIARRFWRNPHWRGWVAFSVACGLWPMVVMPFFGVALNPHSVFAGYAGLFERLATNADTIWSLVLLARLWGRPSIGI
jgi:Protein of unknown function (DUF998)